VSDTAITLCKCVFCEVTHSNLAFHFRNICNSSSFLSFACSSNTLLSFILVEMKWRRALENYTYFNFNFSTEQT
jgi:hypothetical protein